jgi:hypothetical protein
MINHEKLIEHSRKVYKDLAAVHTQHIEHLSNHHSKVMQTYLDTFKTHLDTFANAVEQHAAKIKDSSHPETHKQLHSAVAETALASVQRLKAHIDHRKEGANVFKKSMQRLAMGVFGVMGLSGSLMAADGLSQGGDSAATDAQGQRVESSAMTVGDAATKTSVVGEKTFELIRIYRTLMSLAPMLEPTISRAPIASDKFVRHITDELKKAQNYAKQGMEYAALMEQPIDSAIDVLARVAQEFLSLNGKDFAREQESGLAALNALREYADSEASPNLEKAQIIRGKIQGVLDAIGNTEVTSASVSSKLYQMRDEIGETVRNLSVKEAVELSGTSKHFASALKEWRDTYKSIATLNPSLKSEIVNAPFEPDAFVRTFSEKLRAAPTLARKAPYIKLLLLTAYLFENVKSKILKDAGMDAISALTNNSIVSEANSDYLSAYLLHRLINQINQTRAALKIKDEDSNKVNQLLTDWTRETNFPDFQNATLPTRLSVAEGLMAWDIKDDAIVVYKQVLNHPNVSEYEIMRAAAGLNKCGAKAEAIDAYKQIAHGPDLWEAARALDEMGAEIEAIDAYKKIANHPHESSFSKINAGEALVRLVAIAEAREAFIRGANSKNVTLKDLDQAANGLFLIGATAEAVAVFKGAASTENANWRLEQMEQIGRDWLRRDKSVAIAVYKQLIISAIATSWQSREAVADAVAFLQKHGTTADLMDAFEQAAKKDGATGVYFARKLTSLNENKGVLELHRITTSANHKDIKMDARRSLNTISSYRGITLEELVKLARENNLVTRGFDL